MDTLLFNSVREIKQLSVLPNATHLIRMRKHLCPRRDSNPQVPKETDLQSAEPTNCSTEADVSARA